MNRVSLDMSGATTKWIVWMDQMKKIAHRSIASVMLVKMLISCFASQFVHWEPAPVVICIISVYQVDASACQKSVTIPLTAQILLMKKIAQIFLSCGK